jgi:hypothetical protein
MKKESLAALGVGGKKQNARAGAEPLSGAGHCRGSLVFHAGRIIDFSENSSSDLHSMECIDSGSDSETCTRISQILRITRIIQLKKLVVQSFSA